MYSGPSVRPSAENTSAIWFSQQSSDLRWCHAGRNVTASFLRVFSYSLNGSSVNAIELLLSFFKLGLCLLEGLERCSFRLRPLHLVFGSQLLQQLLDLPLLLIDLLRFLRESRLELRDLGKGLLHGTRSSLQVLLLLTQGFL